tara:strand:- start:752 stop:1342 length:591 start_codon:yes stop_codon:yes gene_type:complete
MTSLKQLKYLQYDLDRWAYSLKLPRLFIFIVLFIYPVTWSIVAYRVNRFIYLLTFKPLKYLLFIPGFFLKRFIEVLMSNEISEKANIGPGFYIAHSGTIIIGAGSVTGKNLSIRHGVTFGGGNQKKNNHPHLGSNVVVGAGAKIIGGVNIANNVIIGANAVVTKDIAENARVAGVPAKVLNYKGVYGINIRSCWNY